MMRETKKSCKKLRMQRGNYTNANAITLIALIITIIIMLILLAVTISILVKSNIIGIAEEAGDKTKTAYEKESNLGSKITINGVEYDGISGYIQSKCSHTWGAWNVIKEPSYTEVGERNRECTKCGLEQTEYPSMLACEEHTYDENDWAIETPATCKAKGLKYVICTRCTTRIEEEIEIDTENGHNFVDGTCTICGESSLPEGAGTRFEQTGEYSDGKKTAMIPAGFTVSGIPSEATIDGGLVIYDIPAEDLEDGTVDWSDPETVKPVYNQFVWIPVEVTEGDSPTSIANFYRSEWNEYSRGETLENSTRYTETTNEEIVADLTNLKASVYENGGFYIGRYEAGSTVERTSSSGVTNVVMVQDAYPYNYVESGISETEIITDGAAYLSKNLYTGKTEYGVNSMLCSGAAWDSMLEFIVTGTGEKYNLKNSSSWGNGYKSTVEVSRGKYATSTFYQQMSGNFQTVSSYIANNAVEFYSKESYSTVIFSTGISELFCSKNIYDVAGNLFEITSEIDTSDYEDIFRGGDAGDYMGASAFARVSAGYVYYHRFGEKTSGDTFRPVLYIVNE